MFQGQYVFSQIIEFIPRREFNSIELPIGVIISTKNNLMAL